MTTDGARPCRDDLGPQEPATAPHDGPPATDLDGTGIDGTGIDGTGIDGTGIDGTGIDGTGIDGDGPDPTPPDEHLVPVLAALSRLEQRAEADAERAAARERVIDRQHEEIERLRAERRSSQLRPTVIDLGRLRNDLLRQAASLPADLSGSDVAALLTSYADSLEEALERCGVAVLAAAAGASFVAGTHQVARVVETADAALDGTVAEIVQDGYAEVDGTIVSPARIKLYRYAQKETTDE